jgi:hypothetical protein
MNEESSYYFLNRPREGNSLETNTKTRPDEDDLRLCGKVLTMKLETSRDCDMRY